MCLLVVGRGCEHNGKRCASRIDNDSTYEAFYASNEYDMLTLFFLF